MPVKDVTNAANAVVWAADLQLSGDVDVTGDIDFPGLGIYNIMHEDYGAVAGDTGDQTAAIQAAIDVAEVAGGIVFVPEGTFRCTSELTVNSDDVVLMGVGEASVLHMVNASVVVDGTGAFLRNCGLEKLRITRDGGAGIALDLVGAGAGTGPIHFFLRDLQATSAAGTGLRMAGAFIGWCFNVNCRGSTTGVLLTPNPTTGPVGVGVNAVSFFGGEIQGNTTGLVMENCRGVGFFGTTIEGNSSGGVDIQERVRGCAFHNCFFETNGSIDIDVGTVASDNTGISILGCHFNDGTSAKDHAITLRGVKGLVIEGNYFTGYAAEPVDVQENAADSVRGIIKANSTETTEDVVALNDAVLVGETAAFHWGSSAPTAGQTLRFNGNLSNATEANVQMDAPFTGYARNMRVRITTAPGAGESNTVRFRVGGANTNLIVSLSESTTDGDFTTGIAEFSKGDLINFQSAASNNGGYAGGTVLVTVELVKTEE